MPTPWDADALDFGLAGKDVSRRRLGRLAAQADAMERMRIHRPTQWARLVFEELESERRVTLDSRLPVEVVMKFFTDVTNHQAAILTEDDFRLWTEWAVELVKTRYPSLAE